MGEVFAKLGINGPLLISQIVNFTILLFILRALLYQPILGMLQQRRERIAQSMKDAERVSVAAQEAEQEKAGILDAARREAQEIRAQASRDAEKIAQEVRSRADQEATDIRMRAQQEASSQVENALADVNKQVAELAIQATEKLLGRELENKADQRRFVAEFLKQNGSA
ncbi:MAG: F0F1 ATP synthase subunit B [Caldilineaceae bacterium]